MVQKNQKVDGTLGLPVELGRHLANIEGCEFIGASDAGEVFVSWHDIDPSAKVEALDTISNWPEVTKVTEVFDISRSQLQEIADALNGLLEETK